MASLIILALQYFRTYEWIILLLFAAYLLYKWWVHPHKKFPPGVRGFPILGALPYLGKYPERVINRWSREKYGPIMSVRFGTNDIVVINEYDELFKAFVQNSSKFVDRPDVPVVKQFLHNLAFAFRPADEEWKEQRKFGMKVLSQYGMGKVNIEERINIVSKSLTDSVKNKGEKPFDISLSIGGAICNNICYFCFGRTSEYEDKVFQELVDSIYNIYGDPKSSLYLGMVMIFHGLQKIPPFKQAGESYHKRLQVLLDFADREIKRHKEIYDESDVKDYIDAFWKEKKIRKEEDGFTDEQLRMSFVDFLIGGTETLSNTLLWGLLCLIHHPEIQSKLHEELDSLYGSGARFKREDFFPSMHDCDKLPYAMAFIQELFRFRTVVPMSLQHKTTATVDLLGYVIPKGTTVIPNIWAIHNDPNLWENPEIFRPERHLDEDGKFVFSKKVIPFGIGGRNCMGEKIARMEGFLMTVHLLKNFQFLPDPDSPDLPIINEGNNGFLYSPHHFKLIAKIR